ncbi:MAG TPA: hypothetical protein VHR47_07645 [Bacillota bacterium]|nr:hypothetical protein [Bacillota bacterium]
MTLSPPEWVLRQLCPNFFSLKIGDEEVWVHFLPFSGRRQLVDEEIYQYISQTHVVLPRREVAGERYFTLPTQRLAIFHPPLVGSPVDYREPEDRRGAVRFLAEFHNAARGFLPEVRPHATLGRMTTHWEHRLRRLEEFTRLAKYRIYPGIVDQLYLEYAEELADGIRGGLEALKRANYHRQCNEYGQVCYFHFQSKFLWKTDGRILPWHFAYCHWDLPIFDLYRLIMEVGRREFLGDEVYRLIEGYQKIRSLSLDELNLLRAFFTFPERLYRLFSAFYLNRTTRSPRRLINRIERERLAGEERKKIIRKIGDIGEH